MSPNYDKNEKEMDSGSVNRMHKNAHEHGRSIHI